jgi:hypothetical protein
MRQRYSTMIESRYSTVWEFWNAGEGTINHAWTGGPLTLMSQYVAGVAPTKPGYSEFQIMPQLGDLTEVAATVPSRKGTISVDIQRGPPFSMQVVVPEATSATVGVPISAVTTQGSGSLEVAIDGTVVYSAGQAMPSPSVTFAGEASDYAKFVVGAGSYAFTAREL